MKLILSLLLALNYYPYFLQAQSTHYYQGEIKIKSPDGIPYGKQVALTKQMVDKKARTIHTQVFGIDQKGTVTEYNFTTKITKRRLYHARYELTDDNGNYTGKGRYTGFPWIWFKWKYQIDFTNPVGKMIGHDRVRFSGLVVKKKFYGADEKVSLVYYEKHNIISKEVFEILYLQLLK